MILHVHSSIPFNLPNKWQDRNSHKNLMARTLQKLRRIYLGRVLVVSIQKLVSTSSSKHTTFYVVKQIQLTHCLQNRSTAAPEMRLHVSALLSLWLETRVSICKCATNKTKETPERVLSLHKSSTSTADPQTCPLPTQNFSRHLQRSDKAQKCPFQGHATIKVTKRPRSNAHWSVKHPLSSLLQQGL